MNKLFVSATPWTGGDASVFDHKTLQLSPQFVDTEATREYYARYLAEIKKKAELTK